MIGLMGWAPHRLAWLSAWLAGVAMAQAPTLDAVQQERRRLEAQFEAEEQACAQRFAVSACVDDVRQRRRAALEPLRERELALEEAERRERAAERRRSAAAKQQAAASRPPASAASPSHERSRSAPRATSSGSATSAASHPDAGSSPAERERQAAERAAAAERRREQAREVQERIARREAERAASGKVSQPLPAPSSASGVGRAGR